MTFHALPIAASLPDNPTLLETISYQAVGLMVVFTALGAIWLLMEAMGMIFRGIERRSQEKLAAALAVPPVVAPEATFNIAPEMVAVITAAAHASLRAGEQVVSIIPLERHGEQSLNVLAWSGEGRRQHFGSHKVR